MKEEYREEEGGRRRGAANCSRFTAHSVGRNAGGFFFLATCAHVGPVAMVRNINFKFSLYKCIECGEKRSVNTYGAVSWYSGVGERENFLFT